MLQGIGATVIAILTVIALLAVARLITTWITDWWE